MVLYNVKGAFNREWAFIRSIEQSENRIITLFGLFENEIGPGVLQLAVQKSMYALNKPKAPGVGHWKSFNYALVVWNSYRIHICWTLD